MTCEVIVGGRKARITLESGELRYESDSLLEAACEIHSLGSGRYSVLINGRSYTAVAIPGGGIAVNGRVHDVAVVDPRAYRSRGTAGRTQGQQKIAAPMPGRVIRVLVEPGQEVAAGQGLIVMEAMKMQNEIKSSAGGKVLEVRAAAGEAVNAGQILMVIA